MLSWTTWPNGKPQKDPTTGAYITDAAYLVNQQGQLLGQSSSYYLVTSASGMVPSTGTCLTRAFTHFIAPTQSIGRLYAEVKQGDCLMDFVVPLVLVANGGSTNLQAGQLVDLFQFNAANRAATNPSQLATATTMNFQLSCLENVTVWMYRCYNDWQNNEHGEGWVQAKIGKDLSQSWESIYGNEFLGQAMLLRRMT
jgi:hypothetical protein